MKKILIVCDNSDFATLMMSLLKAGGFDCVHVRASLARQSIETEQPAAIIVDDLLPHREGRRIRRELRQQPEYPIPILLVTERSSDHDLYGGAWFYPTDMLTLLPISPQLLRIYLDKMLDPETRSKLEWHYSRPANLG
jgi:DNA-binding response OmpR family regulator